MKKIFLLFVIILLSLSYVKTYADCPQGWTSANFTYDYDTNGDGQGDCTITVYYCSTIEPTGLFKVVINKILIEIPCGISLLDDEDFWADIQDQVTDNFMKNGTFPPCPLSVINVIVKRAECWKLQNNPNHQQIVVIDCGLIGHCEWYYKICRNVITGENEKTLITFNSIPSQLCPDEMPQIPPWNKTWYDEWTTECYGVTCVE